MAEIRQQLRQQRQVEPQLGPQLAHRLLGRGAGFGGQHVGGVAGRQLQQEEIEDHDPQRRGDRGQKIAPQRGEEAGGAGHPASG